MKNLKFALFLLSFLSFGLFAESYKPWPELRQNFINKGGKAHAFDQVRCFLERNSDKRFAAVKPSDSNYDRRCYDHLDFAIENQRYFVVIDYTKPSDQKRLFLVDRQTGIVTNMAVAHGRYKAIALGFRLGHLKNSVREIRYYSNEIDSNASSSGLYVSGQSYDGRFGDSIVLFGLEAGINHNACERAVVIHGHSMVSDDKARIMSSGCPMVSASNMRKLLATIAGQKISEDDIGLLQTGSLVYIYSEREARLNCSSF